MIVIIMLIFAFLVSFAIVINSKRLKGGHYISSILVMLILISLFVVPLSSVLELQSPNNKELLVPPMSMEYGIFLLVFFACGSFLTIVVYIIEAYMRKFLNYIRLKFYNNCKMNSETNIVSSSNNSFCGKRHSLVNLSIFICLFILFYRIDLFFFRKYSESESGEKFIWMSLFFVLSIGVIYVLGSVIRSFRDLFRL